MRVALVHGDHLGVLVAEEELEQPVLQRLESRRAPERIAERRVLERRHGREHVPHGDQLRLHARDARQHLERRIEIVAPHAGERRGELVQHEPHPQLRHLVHDDEQHLVVLARQRAAARRAACPAAGTRRRRASCRGPSAPPRRRARRARSCRNRRVLMRADGTRRPRRRRRAAKPRRRRAKSARIARQCPSPNRAPLSVPILEVRESRQAVSRRHRGGRRVVQRAGGHLLRPPRPERRRQDHHHRDHGGHPAADLRRGALPRRTARAALPRGSRHSLPENRAAGLPHRAPVARAVPRPVRPGPRRRGSHPPVRAREARRRATAANSPAASSSGCCSRSRW